LPGKTNGADGVYFTYTEEKPISFNPFYTDDYVFDVEKKDSIKTLLLTLWKSEDDKVTKTESGELGSAVNAYIERIRADRSIVPVECRAVDGVVARHALHACQLAAHIVLDMLQFLRVIAPRHDVEVRPYRGQPVGMGFVQVLVYPLAVDAVAPAVSG
jgi:hypothetical protein